MNENKSKSRKRGTRVGDGVRSARQQDAYPYGRTRLQLVGKDAKEAEFISRLTNLPRERRQSVHWMILQAGIRALTASAQYDDLLPPPAGTMSKVE